MNTLFHLIKNEFVKVYGFKPFKYLLFAVPIMVMITGIGVGRESSILQFSKMGEVGNYYVGFFLGHYLLICVLGIIIINLTTFTFFYIENKSSTWKYLLCMPVPVHLYIVSKVVAAILTNMMIVAIILLVLLVHAALLPVLVPSLIFFGYWHSVLVLLTFMSKFLILSFPVSLTHSLISLFVRKQALMLVLSTFLPIICLYKYLNVLPYGWAIRNFWIGLKNKYDFKDWVPLMDNFEWLGLGVFAMTLLLIFYFKNKLNRIRFI
jgi:hypothetical protein